MSRGGDQQAATVDDVLAAAARTASAAPETPERVLAAFRAAHDEEAGSLPTRPADDWRPARPPSRGRWFKAGAGILVGGVMLGGVAMAAAALPVPSEGPASAPSRQAAPSMPVPSPPRTAPDSGAGPSVPSASGGATTVDRPSTAKDRLAHCQAYEKQVRRGASIDSAVQRRLEHAAGGPAQVAAYCAGVLAQSTSTPTTRSPEGGNRGPEPQEGSKERRNGPAGQGKPSQKPQ
ncbi:hypothetical protein AB0O67_24645 [Streptomyces sp. NPDC086077]|uniref:hypothetical protein n=1 Tax=Streptomyces sp. NPDC086077 TaxID=3154862 RepID=UPI003446B296